MIGNKTRTCMLAHYIFRVKINPRGADRIVVQALRSIFKGLVHTIKLIVFCKSIKVNIYFITGASM